MIASPKTLFAQCTLLVESPDIGFTAEICETGLKRIPEDHDPKDGLIVLTDERDEKTLREVNHAKEQFASELVLDLPLGDIIKSDFDREPQASGPRKVSAPWFKSIIEKYKKYESPLKDRVSVGLSYLRFAFSQGPIYGFWILSGFPGSVTQSIAMVASTVLTFTIHRNYGTYNKFLESPRPFYRTLAAMFGITYVQAGLDSLSYGKSIFSTSGQIGMLEGAGMALAMEGGFQLLLSELSARGWIKERGLDIFSNVTTGVSNVIYAMSFVPEPHIHSLSRTLFFGVGGAAWAAVGILKGYEKLKLLVARIGISLPGSTSEKTIQKKAVKPRKKLKPLSCGDLLLGF